MPEPTRDSTADMVRETRDVAAEIVAMVTRRMVEGAEPAVIGAGIALGLKRIADEGVVGSVIREIAAAKR